MQDAQIDTHGRFILDSGANPTHIHTPPSHMPALRQPLLTKTATNQQTRCSHSGMIKLKTTKNKTIRTQAVANPSLHHNLLSVKEMATRYGLVVFTPKSGYILNTESNPPTLIATAPWRHNHYALEAKIAPIVNHPTAHAARTFARRANHRPAKQNNPKTPPNTAKRTAAPISKSLPPPPAAVTPKRCEVRHLKSLPNPQYKHTRPVDHAATYNWHVRLNHAHPTKLALTAQHRLIPLMPNRLPDKITITCSACDTAKRHPAPHKRTKHNYPVGAYVSSDTCGPVKPTSKHGSNHMLLIVCAVSKFVLAYFLKHRKDIPNYIHAALHHITTRMNHPLRDLRSDNAKEYTSSTMKEIYHQFGVNHHLRTPHQPQENGIAERLNRTIMESVRALLHTAGLDDTYWEDAARDTIFKYNMMHHATTNTSPYQLWYREKPKLKRIFTFGQLGTIPIYAPKKKLEPRADPGRYMYATSLTHIVALNLRTGAYQNMRAEDFHPYHKHSDPTTTTPMAFRTKTVRAPTPQDIRIDTPPPANLAQARHYPDAELWKRSHDAELQNIDDHDSIAWLPPDFTPPPKSVIPLMMIYRYKRSAEGHIVQRKARCNLRGDLMKPGLHYDPRHTTTYTADRTTQRLLIAIHATTKFPLEHFDIKSAYLHEQYSHDHPVYVKQMPRFDGTYKHEGTYGRLVGNLYGSPPAAYYYNHGLQRFLNSLGYESSEHDPCLYTKKTGDGQTLISTTIDDFLVLATNQALIDDLYHQLLTKYKIKRLGAPTRFLNWTITRTPEGIHLSQPDSIDAILHQTNMSDCNPTHTPYNNTKPLEQQPQTSPLDSQAATRFRQILGEVRYITDSTRPDIAYAANRLAQHMAHPQKHHHQALKSLLKYLKGTRTHGLFYPYHTSQPKESHPLQVYSDADFANEKDRKSITGMVHCWHATPITWNSRKQTVVSLSTTEAEYIAATDATRHTTWLRKLLDDTNTKPESPTPHFIDNTSAIMIASSQAPTKQRKYIDIRHHFLQHHAAQGNIEVHRIPTDRMLADIFTKPLQRDRYQKLRTALHIIPRPEQKCGTPTGDCQT